VKPLPSDVLLGLAIQATGSAVVAGFLGTMGIRGWRTMQPLQISILLGFAGVLMLAFSLSFLRLIRPGAPPPPVRIEMLVGLLCLGFPGLCALLFPANLAQHSIRNGLFCLGSGMLLATLVCALLFRLARRGLVMDGTAAGAVAGAIGGIVAATALQGFCPHQEMSHLMVWHGLVIVMSVAVGLQSGRRAAAAYSR
jgi:hypothetical protein